MSYGTVQRLLETCLDADLPILIEGRHGSGKSEIVEAVARSRGIGFLGLDLSAAEPVDLLGLPSSGSGSTTYLPPACLPTRGKGILFLDEVNRILRQLRACLLTLITTRHIPLSGYRLPPGWRIVAACNPSGADYHVDELDPALASRFVRSRLEPEVPGWADWAHDHEVHPEVISFVRSLGNFSADANPRAWVMLSRWLTTNKAWREDPETLTACAEGLVGMREGRAFVGYLMSALRPLSLETVLAGDQGYRSQVAEWTRLKRVDLFSSTADAIRMGMLDIRGVARIAGGRPPAVVAAEVAKFARLCPADIGRRVIESAERYRVEATTVGAKK